MISAAECREKWRNLRTVFMRKMKPLPSGSGAKKKAYYLAEAMQFCLPYIKASAPPSSGNLPQVPQHETTDEISQNAEICDDSASLEDSPDIVQSPQAPPPPPSSNPPASPGPQQSTPVLPQLSTHPPVQSSSTRAKRSLTLRNKSAAVADQCVAEYYKAKKAKLETTVNEAATSSHNIDRKEALKMFLLSLIPELEEFSDSQIKIFKRRVFNVIDEIATPSQPQCSSFLTLLSPQSDSSNTLGISHTSDPSNSSGISPVLESEQVHASPSPSTSLPSQAHQFYTDFTRALNPSDYDVQKF